MTQTIYIVYAFSGEWDEGTLIRFVTDSPSEAIDYFKRHYPEIGGIHEACGDHIKEFESQEIKHFIRAEAFKKRIKEVDEEIEFYRNQSPKLISEFGRRAEINRLQAQKKVFEGELEKLN